MNSLLRRTAVAAVLAASSIALSVQAEALPSSAYHPAFAAVAPHGDPEPLDWRAANDQVRELGGHAGHLRAGRPAAAAPPPQPASPPQAGTTAAAAPAAADARPGPGEHPHGSLQ